jgi:hypothetical protein
MRMSKKNVRKICSCYVKCCEYQDDTDVTCTRDEVILGSGNGSEPTRCESYKWNREKSEMAERKAEAELTGKSS